MIENIEGLDHPARAWLSFNVRRRIMKMRLFPYSPSPAILLCGLFCCVFARAQVAVSSNENESESSTSLTNSIEVTSNLTREEKFKALNEKIRVLVRFPIRNWSESEQTAQELIHEFPDRPDGYDALLNMMQLGDGKHARSLAQEMISSSAPEEYRLWAKGVLYRLDSHGKPVELKFTALDGREVDLSKMRGKVVLIDFWATGCVPCVAALPEIKAVYDKYHDKGFEVVGITFDGDKDRLTRFIKERGLPWPESFEGQGGLDNKFGRLFGGAWYSSHVND